jgi:hypothetical protein
MKMLPKTYRVEVDIIINGHIILQSSQDASLYLSIRDYYVINFTVILNLSCQYDILLWYDASIELIGLGNTMKMLIASKSLLLTMGLIVATPVLADPNGSTESMAISVPKVMRLLQAQGYHDFRKIKIEHDESEIEVEARNQGGQQVELEVDLYTGKILGVERD